MDPKADTIRATLTSGNFAYFVLALATVLAASRWLAPEQASVVVDFVSQALLAVLGFRNGKRVGFAIADALRKPEGR